MIAAAAATVIKVRRVFSSAMKRRLRSRTGSRMEMKGTSLYI